MSDSDLELIQWLDKRLSDMQAALSRSLTDHCEKADTRMAAMETRVGALESVKAKALLVYGIISAAIASAVGLFGHWIWDRLTGGGNKP